MQGYTFRDELIKLGEVRSLIPMKVPILALTATATKKVRSEVIRIIGMREPISITMNPDHPSIRYMVHEFTSISSSFQSLVDDLMANGIDTPRILIYCKRIKDCNDIYDFFETKLIKRKNS